MPDKKKSNRYDNLIKINKVMKEQQYQDNIINFYKRSYGGSNALEDQVFPYMDNQTALYISRDPFMRKIVHRVVGDSLREGFKVVDPDDKDSNDLDNMVQNYFSDHKIIEFIRETWISARVFGTAFLFFMLDDTDYYEEPLDMKKVKNIGNIISIQIDDLISGEIGRVPGEFYRIPESYAFNDEYELEEDIGNVHASRLIRMDGLVVPYEDFRCRNYRHLGFPEYLYKRLKDFNDSHDEVLKVVKKFNQPVYSVSGLQDMVASGREDAIRDRIRMIEESRNTDHPVILDKEDEHFRNETAPFGGAINVLDIQQTLLSGASDIPKTILYGQGPRSGLSSGEGLSEKKDWFDFVRAEQKQKLMPVLRRVIEIILQIKNMPNKKFQINFNPLFQLSDQEKANLHAAQASSDNSYIQSQVLTAEEVALSRFGGSEYSVDTQINKEARSQGINLEEQEDLNKEEGPEDEEEEEEEEFGEAAKNRPK